MLRGKLKLRFTIFSILKNSKKNGFSCTIFIIHNFSLFFHRKLLYAESLNTIVHFKNSLPLFSFCFVLFLSSVFHPFNDLFILMSITHCVYDPQLYCSLFKFARNSLLFFVFSDSKQSRFHSRFIIRHTRYIIHNEINGRKTRFVLCTMKQHNVIFCQRASTLKLGVFF